MTSKTPPPSWRDDMPTDPNDLTGPIPLGLRNRNPGNLRFIADPKRAWNGQENEPGDGGFGRYTTLTEGCRAAAKQVIKHVNNGKNTVEALINTWAPPNENDTGMYVQAVCTSTGWAPDDVLDVTNPTTLFNLLRVIFRVELGGHFVLASTVREGVALALAPPHVPDDPPVPDEPPEAASTVAVRARKDSHKHEPLA